MSAARFAFATLVMVGCAGSDGDSSPPADAGATPTRSYAGRVVVLAGTYTGTYEPGSPWFWETSACRFMPKPKLVVRLSLEKDALIDLDQRRAKTIPSFEPMVTVEGVFGQDGSPSKVEESSTCAEQPEFALSAYMNLFTATDSPLALSGIAEGVSLAERKGGIKVPVNVTVELNGGQFDSVDPTKVKVVGQVAEMFDLDLVVKNRNINNGGGSTTVTMTRAAQ